MPGPSSIPTISNANATEKDSEQKNSKQTKKNTTTTKNADTRTRWSSDKLNQLATKNQKQQQRTTPKTPKGVSKAKTKHSTPLTNSNERAKQAAIQESMKTNPIRRKQRTTSDTDISNRSFIIFNTPDPKPKSIKVFNIDVDPHDDQSYDIVTSNNPEDLMETIR